MTVAVDLFTASLEGIANPANHTFAITPSDANELAFVTSYLYVHGAGNVQLILQGASSPVTLTIAAGTVLPLRVKKVYSTSTTATGLVGMYPTPAAFSAITPPLTSFPVAPVTTAATTVAYTGSTPIIFGGQTPYVWSLRSGTLPVGITVNASTGVVSGTTAVAGTYAGLVVRVTDAGGRVLDLDSFTLIVT